MENFNNIIPFGLSMGPSATTSYQSKRFYSTENPIDLTHVDENGKAKMVDVSYKIITDRKASAQATVYVGPMITKLISQNNMKKGDVLSISEIAGIVGAKRTSDLIPLCHNITLSSVKVHTELLIDRKEVIITSIVRCEGKTGVEMEALTAVSIAALTVYDMCKSISHDIVIKEILLTKKSGGKKEFRRKTKDEGITLKYNKDPIDGEEAFYPIHI